jgi:hypothetical protein
VGVSDCVTYKSHFQNTYLLRYTDTWLRERIAYRIRFRYGYASDTLPIRICTVSDFLLISQFFSTPVDTCLYLGYGPAQQKQCLPEAVAPDARTSCGRAASSERAHGCLLIGHRRRASSERVHGLLHTCAPPPVQGMRHCSPAAVARPLAPPCHPPPDRRAGEHSPVSHGRGQLP